MMSRNWFEDYDNFTLGSLESFIYKIDDFKIDLTWLKFRENIYDVLPIESSDWDSSINFSTLIFESSLQNLLVRMLSKLLPLVRVEWMSSEVDRIKSFCRNSFKFLIYEKNYFVEYWNKPNIKNFLKKRLIASLLRLESFLHTLYKEIMFSDFLENQDLNIGRPEHLSVTEKTSRRFSIKNMNITSNFLKGYYETKEEHVITDFEFSAKKAELPFTLEVISSTMEFFAKVIYHSIDEMSNIAEQHPDEAKLLIRVYMVVRYYTNMRYDDILKEISQACDANEMQKLRDFVLGPKKGSIITTKRRKYAEFDGEEVVTSSKSKKSDTVAYGNMKPKISISRCETLENHLSHPKQQQPQITVEELTPIKLDSDKNLSVIQEQEDRKKGSVLSAVGNFSQHRVSLLKENRNSLLISPTLLNYIIMSDKKTTPSPMSERSTDSSNSSEGDERKEIPSIAKSKLFMNSINMANNTILNMVNPETIFLEQTRDFQRVEVKKKKRSPSRQIVNGTPTPIGLNLFNFDNNSVLPREQVNFTTVSKVAAKDLNKESEEKSKDSDSSNDLDSKTPITDDFLKSLLCLNPENYKDTKKQSVVQQDSFNSDQNDLSEMRPSRTRSRRMDVKTNKLTFLMTDTLSKVNLTVEGTSSLQRRSQLSSNSLNKLDPSPSSSEKKDDKKKKKDDKKKEPKVELQRVQEESLISINEHTVIDGELAHVFWDERKMDKDFVDPISDEELIGDSSSDTSSAKVKTKPKRKKQRKIAKVSVLPKKYDNAFLDFFEIEKIRGADSQKGRTSPMDRMQKVLKMIPARDDMNLFDRNIDSAENRRKNQNKKDEDAELRDYYTSSRSRSREARVSPDFLAREFLGTKLRFTDTGGQVVWANKKKKALPNYSK